MRERLYRSRTDRVLSGVAGGMADWLDVDPSVVRLVWVLLTVFGGAGLILYIVAAIVIPEEPFEMLAGTGPAVAGARVNPEASGAAPGFASAAPGSVAGAAPTSAWMSRAEYRQQRRAARLAEGPGSAPIVVGLVLVLIGAWFLARNYLPNLDDKLFLPGVLIVIGVILLAGAFRRPGSGAPH